MAGSGTSENGNGPGPAPPTTPLSHGREALVVVGIMLSLLMGALDQFVVLTALPTILTDFGAISSGTFVVTAYIVTSTVAIPIFGKLSDLWSRRNVFLGGLAIFVVGSALAGVSQNLNELIVFRAVQGFGSGGFFPVGIAIVAVSFPPETRAKVTGFLSGVFGIATVAGPLLGSAIVDHTSWRWVFYVNLPVGALGAAVLLYALGPLRPAVARRFDAIGAGLLVGWVGALEVALIQVSDAGWAWTDARILGLLGAAVVGATAFVLFELRVAREPLVPVRLLRHRTVGVAGSTSFLVGSVFLPLATFISLVVGIALDPPGANPADTVRNVLYALVLPVVAGAAIGGQLLTRISYRAQVGLGILLAAVGLLGLRGISTATAPWVLSYGFLPTGGIVLPLMPLGFGVGLTFPVFLLSVQNEVEPKDVGEASGLVQFLQQLGGSVGLSLLASFANARIDALDPSPSAVCTTPAAPTVPACLPYLLKLPGADVGAYAEVFTIMLGVLAVGFGIAMLFRGRYLKRAAPVPGPTGPG